MFEHEIKTAPPGSDRLANYTVAKEIVGALMGIEEALSAICVAMGVIKRNEGEAKAFLDAMEDADHAAQPEPIKSYEKETKAFLDGIEGVEQEQAPVSLDPPADAFPRFSSGESFEGEDS